MPALNRAVALPGLCILLAGCPGTAVQGPMLMSRYHTPVQAQVGLTDGTVESKTFLPCGIYQLLPYIGVVVVLDRLLRRNATNSSSASCSSGTGRCSRRSTAGTPRRWAPGRAGYFRTTATSSSTPRDTDGCRR